jgi:hypothetical protein
MTSTPRNPPPHQRTQRTQGTQRTRRIALTAVSLFSALFLLSAPSANSATEFDSPDDTPGEAVTTIPGQRPPTRPLVTAAQAPIVKDAFGNWLIPLVRAGTPTSLTLSSTEEATEFDLPVPAGLQPVELRGTFDPRAESPGSGLKATVGGREFEVAAPNQEPTTFALDLGGLAASKKVASIISGAFELTASEADRECPRVNLNPAQVSDLVLVLGGDTAVPTSVAEFLPPILDRVVIDVPEPVTTHTAEGVLKLTARVIARYADQPVAVVVRSAKTASPLRPEPFTRHFRLVESANPSVALRKPASANDDAVLEIRGSEHAYAKAAEFIGSQAYTTSFTNEVTFKAGKKSKPSKPRAQQVKVTLEQLRRGTAAQGVNRARVRFTARQSDVGGVSLRMTLKITGRVLAISGPARRATVRLSANGRPLASKEVALGDGFSLSGAIEPRVMARENEIVVESDAILDTTAKDSKCAPGAIIRLELDGNSMISSEAGVAVREGFDRFPQAFHDGFDVAMSPMSVAELAAASYIVAGLQEHAQPMLNPSVVAWPKGPIARPSLLVGGTVAEIQRLRPPLVPGPLTIESDGSGVGSVVSAGNAQSLTALEAFETKGIDQLLLATSNKPAELATLADRVRTLQGGWTRLEGDVFVLADGETRMARLRADRRAPFPLPGQKAAVKPRSPFIGVGLGGVAALAALALWVLLRRLYRRFSRPIKK